MDDDQKLDAAAVQAEGLDDWELVDGALRAQFDTGSFSVGLDLVNQVGAAAEEADHHPDIELQYPHVGIKLVSHDVDGITPRDIRLARRISEMATAVGISAAFPE
ncbi:MAG: 4a-hydroxytetrahydrobiopterin dehydratase [Aquihabitans sp.]